MSRKRKPKRGQTLPRLRGVLKGSGALKILEEERRKDREREDSKFR